MPPALTLTVSQDILDGRECSVRLPTTRIPESTIADSDLLSVFDHALPLGISPGYSENGRLLSLSIADNDKCRIIEFQQPKRDHKRPSADKPVLPANIIEGRKLLQDRILCRPVGDIFAFDMGPLAMSLYCDLGMRITHAVDVQSAFSAIDRKPLSAIGAALGKESDSTSKIKINAENVKGAFLHPVYDSTDRNTVVDLAVRAWVSQFLPTYGNGQQVFEKVLRIDTNKLNAQRLDMIAKIANDSLRLDQKKPIQKTHQFQQSVDPTNDQLQLNSTHFNTRMRGGQEVKLQVAGQHGNFAVKGGVAGVSGRSGLINTPRNLTNKAITAVTSIGRDDPTTAEAQRAATILRILQGSEKLLDESPWIQNIWFPESDDNILLWPEEWSKEAARKPLVPRNQATQNDQPSLPLNSSQQKAVNSMLSDLDKNRITLIQGPPGTGKTSVIAAFVQYSCNLGKKGIWLVAQSNVAVKNIAEKLIKSNFIGWKVLVSKDFIHQWHEHLYTEVSNHIIRSDEFNIASNKANLNDVKVMLCTLSMLSNRNIQKFTREIPLRTLVVDEASQIEIGNYISIFSNFKSTLRKTCFIGDDKQLPPFGQEDLQDLQSIFEVPHLKEHVVFLDTQYRMPPQIGSIISELVYENKLKSNPLHPIKDDITVVYFIDVPGKERPLDGGSYLNDLECQAILQLARKLEEQEKAYRIITPYEGQRSFIEKSLEKEGLKWGDKCFNVDSFQGNEDDFIIISVVRSRSMGFLTNDRRTNVMLSRCKKGMFIVSSIQFLQGLGARSLVGQLLKKVEPAVWLTLADIEEEKF